MAATVRILLLAAIATILPQTASAHPGAGDDYKFWARLEKTSGSPYYNYSADFEPRGLGHDLLYGNQVAHEGKSVYGSWLLLDLFNQHNDTASFTDLNMFHQLSIQFCSVPGVICWTERRTWWIPAVLCGNGGVE